MGRFRAALAPAVVGVSVLTCASVAMGQQAAGNEEELRKRVEELEQKVTIAGAASRAELAEDHDGRA